MDFRVLHAPRAQLLIELDRRQSGKLAVVIDQTQRGWSGAHTIVVACVLTLGIRNRSIINILFTRCVVGLVSKNFRTSPARQKLAENFLARLGRTDVSQRCWSYEPSNQRAASQSSP
jgi:hypothetical protein